MEWLEPDDDTLFQIKYNLERIQSHIQPTPETWATIPALSEKYGIITRMWPEYKIADDGITPEDIKWYVEIDYGSFKQYKVDSTLIIIKPEKYNNNYNSDGFYTTDTIGMFTTCDI